MRQSLPSSSALAGTLVVLALLATPPTAATSFVRMSDEELVDRSPVILEGRVLAVEPAPAAERPATDYLVAIDHLHKGFLPAASLILRVPGGVRPDGIGLKILGAPSFAEGEAALLFLTPSRDGTFALNQFLLGAFHLVSLELAPEGHKTVAIRHLGAAREVVVPGRPRPRDGVRELAGFRSWLRDRIAGERRSKEYFLTLSEEDHKFLFALSPSDPFPDGCGETGGHPMRWFDFDANRPVYWALDARGQPGLFDGGESAFRNALAAWSGDPHTPINYLYDGTTTSRGGLNEFDRFNALLVEDPNDTIGGSFSDSGVLALGGPWFSCRLRDYRGEDFHFILGADVVTQDGLHEFFAAVADPQTAARELFAHELGHTLGLDHSTEPEALMFSLLHNDGRGASLDVDDLAGVYFLYGAAVELTPPAAPTDLAVAAVGPTWARLTWAEGTYNESNFRLELHDATGLVGVRTIAAGQSSFTDASLRPETAYTFRLQAQNGAGRSPAVEVGVLTPEDRRPAPPSNLWAAPVAPDRIRLFWQDNADDETAYWVEVLGQDGFIEFPIALPPDTRFVDIVGLDPSTRYFFRIRAENAFDQSDPSNVAGAVTFAPEAACTVSDQRLCLLGGRYAVEVRYRTHDGREGVGQAVPITGEMGVFWFFSTRWVELIVRMDETVGETGEGRVWFSSGSLSDLEYWVSVTDTETGTVASIHNPPGEYCGVTGELAFAPSPAASVARELRFRPPAGDAAKVAARGWLRTIAAPLAAAGESGSCLRGPETLCLVGGRFAATVRWAEADAGGSEGAGQAVAGSDNTGLFWFSDQQRIDLVVKVLDGRAWNGRFWVFYDGLSQREYWLTVRDTLTGEDRVYHHPAGERCGEADTRAFSQP